jgi:hypothetical protein
MERALVRVKGNKEMALGCLSYATCAIYGSDVGFQGVSLIQREDYQVVGLCHG